MMRVASIGTVGAPLQIITTLRSSKFLPARQLASSICFYIVHPFPHTSSSIAAEGQLFRRKLTTHHDSCPSYRWQRLHRRTRPRHTTQARVRKGQSDWTRQPSAHTRNRHSVVTTVRTQAKADKIKSAYPKASKSELDFAIVEDISQPDAFKDAVKSDPPFEAVIHTASPFHFNAEDIQRDLLDPAIIGTTGILKAIKASAPTVKRVVCRLGIVARASVSKSNRSSPPPSPQ